MWFFKSLLFVGLIMITMYYLSIVFQLLDVLTIVEDKKFKFTWKYLIPFYQFYKITKNEF